MVGAQAEKESDFECELRFPLTSSPSEGFYFFSIKVTIKPKEDK